jgi:hypothetical protein
LADTRLSLGRRLCKMPEGDPLRYITQAAQNAPNSHRFTCSRSGYPRRACRQPTSRSGAPNADGVDPVHCQCAHHLLPKLPNRMKSGPLRSGRDSLTAKNATNDLRIQIPSNRRFAAAIQLLKEAPNMQPRSRSVRTSPRRRSGIPTGAHQGLLGEPHGTIASSASSGTGTFRPDGGVNASGPILRSSMSR